MNHGLAALSSLKPELESSYNLACPYLEKGKNDSS